MSTTITYDNSVDIKKDFAKHFPLTRLVFAFHTIRCNIHLEFFTKDEAEEVFTSWKSNFLGSETLIKKAVDPEKPDLSLRITSKACQTNSKTPISRNYWQIVFKAWKHPGSSKKDGTKLETVKLVAKNLNDAERVIWVGIFIESLFYRPIVFQQRWIQVIRCFKCQRLGHVSKNCKSTPRCGHCSSNHNFKSCDKKDSSPNWANCNDNHETDAPECPLIPEKHI